MVFDNKTCKSLENPQHPLLGPVLRSLYWIGLISSNSTLRNSFYIMLRCCACSFVLLELINVYNLRNDINMLLSNISITALSIVTLLKCLLYVRFQEEWEVLTNMISEEELSIIEKKNLDHMKIMNKYIKYSRVVIYLYWILVSITLVYLLVTPLLRYLALPSYREDIKNGDEPYPEIIGMWLPLDKNTYIGCTIACIIAASMGTKGSLVVAAYDTNVFAVMIFLKGQMEILKNKCENIFEGNISTEHVLLKIKECHRHHNFLLRCYKLFNSLLSPIMFAYVLVCSIAICFSVLQFVSDKATTFQKLWVVEYTSALISQLFLYCWHSNEVIVESSKLDGGVFGSNWWKADVRLRKHILLLAGKLAPTLVLNAGPFTTLSVATFIEIMKGAYSFFTLISQVQN